jgi:hypothetical protein
MMLLLTPLQGFITRAFARTQGKVVTFSRPLCVRS